jgi:hypothetical protein
MNELAFDQDARHADPNESAHRRARFCDGWKNATGGRTYAAETLRDLTWENLGYRLGRLFGDASPELIDQFYDWAVRQQAERRPRADDKARP